MSDILLVPGKRGLKPVMLLQFLAMDGLIYGVFFDAHGSVDYAPAKELSIDWHLDGDRWKPDFEPEADEEPT